MNSEIDEEAERLTKRLIEWADDLGVPIDDLEENAVECLECLGYSDDPAIPEWIEFVKSQEVAHTAENQMLVIVNLVAAAMSLLCFHHINSVEKPAWSCLIRAAERLALVDGLLFSVVVERTARALKLSAGGKKGAQAKHQNMAKFKDWAVAQSQKMRGSDADISRRLVLAVPSELADVSKSPERAIYDAIRAARNRKN